MKPLVVEQKIRLDLLLGALIISALGALGAFALTRGALPVRELLHFAKDVLVGLVLACGLLMAAYGPGALVLRLLRFQKIITLEFFIYACALGLGVLAHLTLGLGALGWLYPAAAWGLLLAGWAASLFEVIFHWQDYRLVLPTVRLPERVNWFSAILLAVIAAFAGYSLVVNALPPPLSWDEVAYHLAIPKIYIQNHAVIYISFIPYANWPLESEMLFTLGLLLGSETFAHLVTWSAMLLSVAAIYAFGRKHLSQPVGLLAAAIFASTPVVNFLAGTALIELPLTLYTALAVFVLLDWLEERQGHGWLLSAIFGGLAASAKMNAALVPLILGVFMLVILIAKFVLHGGLFTRHAGQISQDSEGESIKGAIGKFAVYGVTAFVVVLPWYLKSWVLTGNPVWPFLLNWLGGRDWDALGNEYLFGFIQKPNLALTPLNWLLAPWELTVHPLLFGPTSFRLGPLYLTLLPLGLLAWIVYRFKSGGISLLRKLMPPDLNIRTTGSLLLLGLVFYTSWFFQTHQSRFMMPVTPVLALIGAAGAGWLWSPRGALWKITLQAAMLVVLLASSWLASPEDWALVASRWPYLSGQQNRDQFLTSQVSGYKTFIYANDKLPADARIWLALFEARGYYLNPEYMWANPISQRAMRLEDYQTAAQLAAALRQRGFTYIFYRNINMDKYTGILYGKQIESITLDLLASSNVQLIFKSNELELYKLLP